MKVRVYYIEGYLINFNRDQDLIFLEDNWKSSETTRKHTYAISIYIKLTNRSRHPT